MTRSLNAGACSGDLAPARYGPLGGEVTPSPAGALYWRPPAAFVETRAPCHSRGGSRLWVGVVNVATGTRGCGGQSREKANIERMNELPRDLARPRIRLYLQMQLDAVDAKIQQAESAAHARSPLVTRTAPAGPSLGRARSPRVDQRRPKMTGRGTGEPRSQA